MHLGELIDGSVTVFNCSLWWSSPTPARASSPSSRSSVARRLLPGLAHLYRKQGGNKWIFSSSLSFTVPEAKSRFSLGCIWQSSTESIANNTKRFSNAKSICHSQNEQDLSNCRNNCLPECYQTLHQNKELHINSL
jgi:hypothetical protein